MTTKDTLKELIDQLPDSELHAVKRFVEYVRDAADPLLNVLLDAPHDDKELNEETLASLDEGELDLIEGRVASHEDLNRQQGL